MVMELDHRVNWSNDETLLVFLFPDFCDVADQSIPLLPVPLPLFLTSSHSKQQEQQFQPH